MRIERTGDYVLWQMHVTEYEVTRAVIKQHPATTTLLERIEEAERSAVAGQNDASPRGVVRESFGI